MPKLSKSAIVPHACETMFELVDRVEAYPQFLPWCAGVQLIERSPEITSARIDISWRGLETSVATRNAKRPPEAMALEFLEGPFESFTGEWRFAKLGDAGCRVEFSLDYTFSNRALELALGPLFAHIMGEVVDRFVARAEQVAG